jgi:hypothetical protein
MSTVYVKLFAATVALCAGVAAVLLVVLFVRDTLG